MNATARALNSAFPPPSLTTLAAAPRARRPRPRPSTLASVAPRAAEAAVRRRAGARRQGPRQGRGYTRAERANLEALRPAVAEEG
jgi:hypothetical protein